MSGPMVRAILEGRKTQTRRAVRAPTEDLNHPAVHHWQMDAEHRAVAIAQSERAVEQYITTFPHYRISCPYGVPGDRLWIRETWQEVHPAQVAEGRFSVPGRAGIPGPPSVNYRVIYRADGEYPRLHFKEGPPVYPYREVCLPGCMREHLHPQESWTGWQSAIHMPRWASRITLEVTSVRVERPQDISEADAKAEGCALSYDTERMRGGTWRGGFRDPWDSINAERAPWASNPLVWAVEFKRICPA